MELVVLCNGMILLSSSLFKINDRFKGNRERPNVVRRRGEKTSGYIPTIGIVSTSGR